MYVSKDELALCYVKIAKLNKFLGKKPEPFFRIQIRPRQKVPDTTGTGSTTKREMRVQKSSRKQLGTTFRIYRINNYSVIINSGILDSTVRKPLRVRAYFFDVVLISYLFRCPLVVANFYFVYRKANRISRKEATILVEV
jgi:hypothetical protein